MTFHKCSIPVPDGSTEKAQLEVSRNVHLGLPPFVL
jgi:hypothetical protein